MSPTVLRVKGFWFYSFSREEARAHVHVQHAEGEAKFWLEPIVELHATWCDALSKSLEVVVAEDTAAVGVRQDPQRPVAVQRVIKTHPQRNHALERLHIE